MSKNLESLTIRASEGKPPTPPRTNKGLIADPVHPRDFMRLNFTFCCEQCVHFDQPGERCTMDQDTRPHRRTAQLDNYQRTGRMFFCRNLEID